MLTQVIITKQELDRAAKLGQRIPIAMIPAGAMIVSSDFIASGGYMVEYETPDTTPFTFTVNYMDEPECH
jgi:hypothetical protein